MQSRFFVLNTEVERVSLRDFNNGRRVRPQRAILVLPICLEKIASIARSGR
jgi:hypothetical protein